MLEADNREEMSIVVPASVAKLNLEDKETKEDRCKVFFKDYTGDKEHEEILKSFNIGQPVKMKPIIDPLNLDVNLNHASYWVNIGGQGQTQYIGVFNDLYAMASNNSLYRFDRVYTRWAQLSGSGGKIGGAYNGKFYAVSTDNLGVWEYDVPTNAWTKIKTVSLGANYCSMMISGGDTIYCVFNGLGLYKYDGTPDSWTLMSSVYRPSYAISRSVICSMDSSNNCYMLVGGSWTQFGTGYTYGWTKLMGGNFGDIYMVNTNGEIYVLKATNGTIYSTGSSAICGAAPIYVVTPTGIFAVSTNSSVYTSRKDNDTYQTWNYIATQPNPTGVTSYNDTGALSSQPILADSNGVYILISC